MRIIGVLFRPLIFILNGSANWVLHRLGVSRRSAVGRALGYGVEPVA